MEGSLLVSNALQVALAPTCATVAKAQGALFVVETAGRRRDYCDAASS
jgi:hypothetical protein